MDKSFLAAYVSLLIRTCHLCRAHAIGGMAAYIPVKNEEKANKLALENVRQNKLREANAGHDGTWIAHPGLVSIAIQVFDESMPKPNQISSKKQYDKIIGQKDLLDVPEGNITLSGLKTNINVGLRYLTSWLGGRGAVPINNLMEDAATAEICRAQIWQMIHHKARLDYDELVDMTLFRANLRSELAKIKEEKGHSASDIELATKLLEDSVVSNDFFEFLTLPAYAILVKDLKQ
jgi:malate synthase